MTVTLDHLTKYLKTRMRKGDYGSVLINIKNGEVTQVTEKKDFNGVNFVEHAEKPVTRYILTSKKKEEEPGIDNLSTDCQKVSETATIEGKEPQDDT